MLFVTVGNTLLALVFSRLQYTSQFVTESIATPLQIECQSIAVCRSMSPGPIYTPEWRETIEGGGGEGVEGGRHWASNHQPSALKSNALTSALPHPYKKGRAYWNEGATLV